MTSVATVSTASGRIGVPRCFVKNAGQENAQLYFTANEKGRRLGFAGDRILVVELERPEKDTDFFDRFKPPSLPCRGISLEIAFTGAREGLAPKGLSKQPGCCHYFKGSDHTKWQTGVSVYEMLFYPAVWEGVDLELSSTEDGLKMNWLLDDPGKTASIGLRWAGADSLEVNEAGDLLVHHALGTLIDPVPFAYQEIAGKKVPVGCAYRLDDEHRVGFELHGDYDAALPLVIDPILKYATYLGGSSNEGGSGIAVDPEGCAYVAGTTLSDNFPVTPGAFQTTLNGSNDVFITKLSADGQSLIYSTFLGGNNTNAGQGIAVDTAGYAYVVGYTSSADFPVTPSAFQSTYGGGDYDVFIAKLAPNGQSLVYSTFLGGDQAEKGNGIAVDAEGCAYVTGYTSSLNFPVTPGAFQPIYGGGNNDGFVTKLAADGQSLIYSTFLGGNDLDEGFGIAVDAQGQAYVAGSTKSADFPVTPGSFQTSFDGTYNAAFITKFATDGNSLVYSTFLSGTNNTVTYSIVVDAQGHAYVTGLTNAYDFPTTPGAFQTTQNGSISVIVTKLSLAGDRLEASTYLGPGFDLGNSIAIDAQGRAYVTGQTYSVNFPITPAVLPSSLSGTNDAFVSIFSPDFSTLLVSYYLGGSSIESGQGIVVTKDGVIYTTGSTGSTNFPVTPDAYQPSSGGAGDAYITKSAFAFYNQASLTIQGII